MLRANASIRQRALWPRRSSQTSGRYGLSTAVSLQHTHGPLQNAFHPPFLSCVQTMKKQITTHPLIILFILVITVMSGGYIIGASTISTAHSYFDLKIS